MRGGKDAHVEHGAAEGGFDDPVAHADDQEEEEGKRVAPGVEDGDDDHEDFVEEVVAVAVLVV